MFRLQAFAGREQLGAGAQGEAGGDGVEIAALAVIAVNEALGVRVEILGRVGEVLRHVLIDAGEARDDTHIAAAGFLEEGFGGDGGGRGEGLAGGGAGRQQRIKEADRALARIVGILVAQFLRDHPLLQPGQQLLAIGADHARLGKVNMAVDEAGQDEPVGIMGDRKIRIGRGDLREGPEGADDAVFHHQEAVGQEAGGLFLGAHMRPGVVHEVKEAAANAHEAHVPAFPAGRGPPRPTRMGQGVVISAPGPSRMSSPIARPLRRTAMAGCLLHCSLQVVQRHASAAGDQI